MNIVAARLLQAKILLIKGVCHYLGLSLTCSSERYLRIQDTPSDFKPCLSIPVKLRHNLESLATLQSLLDGIRLNI